MPHNTSLSVVLVVEDNVVLAELIQEIVNSEPGYRALAVPDASIALDVISQVRASLILLDVELGGMSGLDLYDLLQNEYRDRAIPVLFMTAGYYEKDFKRRGIKEYLSKPFSVDQLLDRVGQICRATM